MHLDAYGILDYADGYDIKISSEKIQSNENKKLYFVNLGGYDSKKFTELHENVFAVAVDQVEAKLKALRLVQGWEVPHRDYLFEAENVINISEMIKEQKFYINLTKTDKEKEFKFTCKYTPIGI